jgi:hypothetical protein
MRTTKLHLFLLVAAQLPEAFGRLGAMVAKSPSGFRWLTSVTVLEDNLDITKDVAVPDQFIVKFENGLTDEELEQKANEAALLMGGEVRFIYRHVFKGAAIVKVAGVSTASVRTSNSFFTIEQVSARQFPLL